MTRKFVCAAYLCLLMLVVAAPLLAQDAPQVFTRVALWDVKRDQWGAFVKHMERNDQPVFEALMKDGIINEWGIDANGTHSPEGYTHTTWYSATTMGALQKVDEAFDKTYPGVKGAAIEAQLSAMLVKHRDLLLGTVFQKAKASQLHRSGYFFETSVQVHRGKAAEHTRAWTENTRPVFQKLFDEGVVLAFGLSYDAIVTEKPGMRYSWFVVKDLSGYDKVSAAFRAAQAQLSEAERARRRDAAYARTEADSYRSHFSNYIHWAIAAQ